MLIDAPLSYRLVEYLAALGVDAMHVEQLELGTASDEQIMIAAARLGRAVLTQDRDFGALLAKSKAGGPSVLLLRSDRLVRPREQAARIGPLLIEHGQALGEGAIVVIENNSIRVRRLPL